MSTDKKSTHGPQKGLSYCAKLLCAALCPDLHAIAIACSQLCCSPGGTRAAFVCRGLGNNGIETNIYVTCNMSSRLRKCLLLVSYNGTLSAQCRTTNVYIDKVQKIMNIPSKCRGVAGPGGGCQGAVQPREARGKFWRAVRVLGVEESAPPQCGAPLCSWVYHFGHPKPFCTSLEPLVAPSRLPSADSLSI